MPVVVAEDLVHAYGSRALLEHVSLSLEEGERVGLVGENGSGKSTLARVLAGRVPPDGGRIALRRGAKVLYLEQEPALPDDQTAREVVTAGLAEWRRALDDYARIADAMASGRGDLDALAKEQTAVEHAIEQAGGWERSHDVDAALLGLGVRKPDAPCGEASGGERRRIALARLLVAAPDLAILDEPTNHLDAQAIDWLERTLRERFRGAVLLVTHDRWLLDRVTDRTLELENGALHAYQGGWDAYLEGKAQRLEQDRRTEANRRNFLRTELEWLRRSPAARSTKQRARVERAEAAIAAKPEAERAPLTLTVDTTRLGKTIVDARGLSVERGGRTLVRGLDLTLRKGERVALVGANGVGKTSLLRVLLGEDPPAAGEVVRGPNTRFAYLDQHRSGLDEAESLENNVTGGARRIEFAGQAMDSRAYLGRFGFDADAQRKKVGSLSGGERARAALAKLLLAPANVVVLDEPTNDLDVTTLAALEGMILEADLTALLVSHDRYFLDRVATAILALDGEGGATLVQGGFEAYSRYLERQRVEASAAEARVAARTSSAPAPTPASRPAKNLTYGERLELEALMPQITALEERMRALDEASNDPALYADVEAARAHAASRAEVGAALERATERWMELEEKRGG